MPKSTSIVNNEFPRDLTTEKALKLLGVSGGGKESRKHWRRLPAPLRLCHKRERWSQYVVG